MPTASSVCDTIVLGGGAAGLMAAAIAGQRGRSVILMDHADHIGSKILISGGGRCNFTNLHCAAENFLSANPHFARSALARYTPQDFLALVERYGIAWHEKTLGQLFCDRSAADVVSMLQQECDAAGVSTRLRQQVTRVEVGAARGNRFTVHANGEVFNASTLVVATGGLSIPKMGATDLAYRIARQFDIAIEPCRPALVPFTWQPEDASRYADLTGLSTEVVTSVSTSYGKARFREKLLFTHRGLSGPAVLQISSYWQPGAAVAIDLAPDRDCTAGLRAAAGGRDAAGLRAALRTVFPQRLADRWAELHLPERWNNPSLLKTEQLLHDWLVEPGDTEGYSKAEVTAGGISTAELSPKTMESRRVAGLYFIGEAVDVTGHLGGYNFQWAWASGFAAGSAV